MIAAAAPPVDRLRSALGDTYAIDRELGRGGMATVYLAQDVKHDRLVALKVLHPEVAESLGADRFLREIRTAARLNHPHILPLFDSGEVEGFLYYVMPYVEGESLRQLLDRLGHIEVEDAIDYATEMAAALDYSHRRGVVHRDIKPENVMLHEGIAMLMDFGIAKALDNGAGTQLTVTGMFVGTPAYVSPEQAFGEVDIDGRSDQFSLACMLHEMITGEQLFTGSSPQAVIAKRMSNSAPALESLEGRVAPEVKKGLIRAMSLEPDHRFDTMREFASCLVAGGRSTPQALRFVDAPAIAASKSVAVLPFSNMSADPENEYLADGIAEEIISALSKVRTLRVASRALSFAMKGKTGDLGEIGRKLKVSTVLAGSVRKSGNRIRVSAELINAADGAQLWVERYDRQMEDVFEIQDDISESIVRALRVILGDAERKALKARTRDVRAYEYYLRGQQFVDMRRKSVQYAIEMFARAIAIDTVSVPLWILLPLATGGGELGLTPNSMSIPYSAAVLAGYTRALLDLLLSRDVLPCNERDYHDQNCKRAYRDGFDRGCAQPSRENDCQHHADQHPGDSVEQHRCTAGESGVGWNKARADEHSAKQTGEQRAWNQQSDPGRFAWSCDRVHVRRYSRSGCVGGVSRGPCSSRAHTGRSRV